jgi:hypothetical protein
MTATRVTSAIVGQPDLGAAGPDAARSITKVSFAQSPFRDVSATSPLACASARPSNLPALLSRDAFLLFPMS